MLKDNSRQFLPKLKALRNATDQPLQMIVRSFMTYLIVHVAERTPVSPVPEEDPGRLQGSWTISRDKVGVFVIPKGQTSSLEEAVARASSTQFSNPYARWYLYNRVEYGEVVEYGLYPGHGPRTTTTGFSTQAPAGMLRLTMAEAYELLKEVQSHVQSQRKN